MPFQTLAPWRYLEKSVDLLEEVLIVHNLAALIAESPAVQKAPPESMAMRPRIPKTLHPTFPKAPQTPKSEALKLLQPSTGPTPGICGLRRRIELCARLLSTPGIRNSSTATLSGRAGFLLSLGLPRHCLSGLLSGSWVFKLRALEACGCCKPLRQTSKMDPTSCRSTLAETLFFHKAPRPPTLNPTNPKTHMVLTPLPKPSGPLRPPLCMAATSSSLEIEPLSSASWGAREDQGSGRVLVGL